MDVSKIERDFTQPPGVPEATVVRPAEGTGTEGVDSEPSVTRRRSRWGIKRIVAFILPILVAGIAVYRPFEIPLELFIRLNSFEPPFYYFGFPLELFLLFFNFPVWFDYVFIILSVVATFGTYKLYRRISPKGLMLPALMVLVAGGLLAGALYGVYVLLGLIDNLIGQDWPFIITRSVELDMLFGLSSLLSSSWPFIVPNLVGAGLVIVAIIVTLKLYGWYTRRFENREAREISLRGQVLPILIGLVVGILLAGAQNLIALGYAGSNIFTLFTSIDQYLLIFINTSFWLNVLVVFLFWVILFRRIQTALGSYAAIVLMAIISVLISRFTLVLISSLAISGVNPDLVVSLPSFRTELWMLGVGLSWGILLGVVYQATKNMWMAAAMYAFYPVFAIAGKPVLNYTPFMPESGLFPERMLSIPSIVLPIVLPLIIAIPFLIYAIKKGHIVRPRLLTSLRR